MRLSYFYRESKTLFRDNFLYLTLILSIFTSYGIGYLSAIETFRIPILIERYGELSKKEDISKTNHIFASKSGSKFYFSWCSGGNRIKNENKIYFKSVEEAQNRGYEIAKNCPGI